MNTGMIQKQTAGMIPEHFMGKLVLKLQALELEGFIEAQLAENPALTLKEEATCPACGSDVTAGRCFNCGLISENCDSYRGMEFSDVDNIYIDVEDFPEPFSNVASPHQFKDYLKEQIHLNVPRELCGIAEFIVDYLDEDGYLREPLVNIATSVGLSVLEVEEVLKLIQKLDPPGSGARDLRECLLIQLDRLDAECDEASIARLILSDYWELLARLKLDKLAAKIGVSREKLSHVVDFIRDHLNPYPASMFSDPWDKFTPRDLPKVVPDIEIHCTDEGLVAEIADSISHRVTIDRVYATLWKEISQKKRILPQKDCVHIRESVAKARSLIEALEFRRSTLRKIADEIVRYQAEFFIKGPSALKPMTKKDLAQRIGLHESTVCRATQGKMMRLPSGEVILLETLFDSALPIKEMIRELCAEKLTDGEIAQRLREKGINIARRTVAKYREQIKIPPFDHRVA
jgi:RNA polymerase sigma-54 factor